MKPTYFRPGTLHKDDGTTHDFPRGHKGEEDDEEGDEWVLIDSTPASCVQIGLYHFFQERGPIDLVVSGPNYGRNSTGWSPSPPTDESLRLVGIEQCLLTTPALFALSSGTIGGAMEAANCGKRAVALSYAFSSRDHDPVVISEASRHSVKLIEHLAKNWKEGVDLYTVNVPLEPGVSQNKVLYTAMLDNRWSSGSCFQAVPPGMTESPDLHEQELRAQGEKLGEAETESSTRRAPANKSRIEHKHFQWSPNFSDVYRSVEESAPGNDGWVVKEGMTRYVHIEPVRSARHG